MNTPPLAGEHRAIILAPWGRDAALATSLLREAGLDSAIVANAGDIRVELDAGASMVLITEEALRHADLKPLARWVREQPSWSDLPFLVITDHVQGLERNPAAARLTSILGNVTFVERPFHPTTLVSVAQTALRGRHRQYEARTTLKRLREGEDRLNTALKAGRLGPWEYDAGTGALAASDACKANFGRPPGASFSQSDLLFAIHPGDAARVRAAMHDSLTSGVDYEAECRCLWPTGEIHWIDMRARVIRGQNGAGDRLVGVSTDITQRKLAEHELRRLNENLELRVVQRTRELELAHQSVLEQIDERERAEQKLIQSQKMEAIGQLTGGIAHDFNNLLMAVLGNLELLEKRMPQEPRLTRLVNGALQGARRGAVLTQRLLAFSRRQNLQSQPVDLGNLVMGMANLLERSVGPRVEIVFDVPTGLPQALADPNQVELALLNLAVNARDAMPDGGTLSITLAVARAGASDAVAPGDYLQLSVGDTGVGMDEATLKRAVEPFFSTKQLGKGTGLGLSMIHGMAHQSGGMLQLHSTKGRGTTAELWLPVTDARAETVEPVAEPAPPDDCARARILLIDDDPLIASSTVDMLLDLGHEVLDVNSAASALDLLQRGEPFDLLITDHAMPGMTGVELAGVVRQMRPGLPILLATGYAELAEGLSPELPRLGKPYTQRELARHLARLLGKSAG